MDNAEVRANQQSAVRLPMLLVEGFLGIDKDADDTLDGSHLVRRANDRFGASRVTPIAPLVTWRGVSA